MKVILALLMIVLSYTTVFSKENLNIKKENDKTKYMITQSEIVKLLNSKKKDILKNEGKYTIVETGAEGSFEGYAFRKKGIIVIFEYDETVKYIECMDNLKYNEVSVGMTFDEIKKILGEEKINKRFYESEENIEYELFYNFEKFALQFTASDKRKKTDSMIITKGISKKEINLDWINKVLNMKKNEVEKELGNNTKIYKANYEGYKDSYYYNEFGFSIVYNQEYYIDYIEIENRKKIFDITAGLGFDEIKNIYSGSVIKRNKARLFDEKEEEDIYEIIKIVDGITLQFWAIDKKASSTFLRIRKANN